MATPAKSDTYPAGDIFSLLAPPWWNFCPGLPHRLQRNDMHANRSTADEKKDRCLHNDHAKTMVLDHVGNSGFHGGGDALDRFTCATLTERVVSFLDRYNLSICSV